MQYRLLALDMDQTLLDSHGQLAERNRVAIQRAAAQGVVITLATGRMFAACRRYAEQLDLNVPLITYNGALVKTYPQGEIIDHRPLSLDVAQRILDYAYREQLYLQVYVNDEVYVDHITEDAVHYGKLTGVPIHAVGDLRPFLQVGPTKILFIHDGPVLDQIAGQLQIIGEAHIHAMKSKPRFLEVVHPQVSKGQAVKHLARYFHIDREQVVAIGDSYNDVEMLHYAGLGVAMGNAPDFVKQQADYITGTCGENGVAQVIEKFILQAD